MAAIVKAYIETGEPIGSKNLMLLLENAPSSATLRNEMNELCALGFLNQPHTSAGRIPTSQGYRFYIDSVMKPDKIEIGTQSYIDREMGGVIGDPDGLHRHITEMLASLTGFPSISIYLADSDITLREVQLLPIARRSAVLLMITSDGRTYSRICRLPEDVNTALTERFCEIVKEKLRRLPLWQFSRALLQTVTASVGLELFSLLPLFTELFDMANRAAKSTVTLSGGEKLYGFCSEGNSHKIMSLINAEEPIIRLLSAGGESTQTLFGSDTEYAFLNDTAIVTAPYRIGNRCCGRIGIIGSRRMPYEQIYPSIEYAAQSLSGLLTAAAKDMED